MLGVYITSCNYRPFIRWALDSVLAQTRKPDVIVFVDDASVDGSPDFIKSFNADRLKFDDFIVHAENQGTVKTINEGAQRCIDLGCDIFCGLSADDVFKPTYLEETEKFLLAQPENVGYVYTHVRRIGDENQYDIHPEFNADLLRQMPYVHGSSLFRSIAWQDAGGLRDLPREEDWDLTKRLAELGWKGKLLPQALLLWRKHRNHNRTVDGNDSGKLREAEIKKGGKKE